MSGVHLPPNACGVCGKWLPPWKAAVPSECADAYCWQPHRCATCTAPLDALGNCTGVCDPADAADWIEEER